MSRRESNSIGMVLAAVPSYSETFFMAKIHGLAARGFEVTLLARGKYAGKLPATIINPWPVPNYPVLRLILALYVIPLTWCRAPLATIRFWRLEKGEGSSILERLRLIYINAHILPRRFHWLSFGFATQAIGRECVARAIGARMTVSFRGYDISVYPQRNPGCYTRLWKYVDQVHSLSAYLLKKAINLGLSPFTHAVIIPPAINMEDFDGSAQTNRSSEIRILTVARLHWIKGLEYALLAMKILVDQGIRVQYTIVGEGSEYEKLIFEIDSLGLNSYVVLAGRKEPQEVKELMQNSDLYLQPSLDEGFCNAVIEAQASGLLCIVSAVGGLLENIENQVTGWLVPPRDFSAIAATITKVIRMSTGEQREISVESRKRARARFGLTTHLDAWKLFYGHA